MSQESVFLILCVGLAVGIYLGNRFAKNDFLARFGWAAVGAVPGAAFLVGEPKAILVVLVMLPLLGWRYRAIGQPTSTT